MALYQYTAWAVDDRKVFKSTCNAPSESVVRSKLKRIGYAVDSVSPKKTSQIFGQRKRIKLQDIVSMCRRFSIMYRAGLNIMDCLSLLAKENESKKLSDILQDVHSTIARGSKIADAFSKYQNVFSALFVNMIRAGEISGKLDYVLGESAAYMEKQYDLRRKVRQALTYPAVVMFVIFTVVAAIMIFVVPVFSEVYLKLGIALPVPTRALILLSNNAVYIFPTIIVLTVGLWVAYIKLRPIPGVRRHLDKMKLSVPMIGPVYHKILLLRFIRTLCVTLKAGLELPEAITVAEDVADNAVISEATGMINHSIKRGGTITEAVNLHGFFPQSITHAFAAGEEAGKLDETLTKFADSIEQDVDNDIKKLITKVEPALVMLLTLIVGFIAMAIYLPIFDMMRLMRHS
jgi:type IV pilus assembly protein PilC